MSEQHKSGHWSAFSQFTGTDYVHAIVADAMQADHAELARLNQELAATVAERDRAQAACEQMGGRIAALEERNAQLERVEIPASLLSPRTCETCRFHRNCDIEQAAQRPGFYCSEHEVKDE